MSAELRPSEAISDLEVRLAQLAYEARCGDPAIEAELVAVEDEIAAHDRMVKLEALAREEHDRREQEQAELERRAEQARDERVAAQALHTRDLAVHALQQELVTLGERVRALLDADAEAERAGKRAGRSCRSLRQTAAELIVIACRDAGLEDDPLGYVRASVRASILAQYPPVSETSENRETIDTTEPRPIINMCSICTHEQRHDIEAALAWGFSYRQTAERFGVSKSALSRHTAHTTP